MRKNANMFNVILKTSAQLNDTNILPLQHRMKLVFSMKNNNSSSQMVSTDPGIVFLSL